MIHKYIFLVLAFFVSLASAASTPPPIKMAIIDPFSGSVASYGLPALANLKVAIDDINQRGGINGQAIELVEYDSKLNPQESSIQLQKAIDADIRFVIQGIGSSVVSGTLGAIEKHNKRNPEQQVLLLNYSALDPTFTNERCSFWHFRFALDTDTLGDIYTSWIEKQPQIKKIFLINEDYSYGHSIASAITKTLDKKRPDIEIVANVFHPLAKVKDFSPYISQIRSSGADAVVTGNVGQDITLLINSAADSGLDIPFLTFAADSAGTITIVGTRGVDRVYLISDQTGTPTDEKLIARQKSLYAETGWDLNFQRIYNMMEMFKIAVEKAGNTDPVAVATAMEDVSYDSPYGRVFMNKQNHQVSLPMFIEVLKDNMPVGLEGTKLNFSPIDKFSAEQVSNKNTCDMQRP